MLKADSEWRGVMPRISRRGMMGQLGAVFALVASSGPAGAKTQKNWPTNIIRRGSEGYEDARQAAVWAELKPDRFPDGIAQPTSVGEVVKLVDFARQNGQTVAVRGSGHNYFASFLRDGGIMLDMSGLNEIELQGEIARIGPGVQSGPLAMVLQEQGRVFPTAHNADVGLAGFLLGGGMGWNGEDWGQFACFAVQSLDVVTAGGELVVASESSNPDLFWAARGGGLFFPGVVVGFQLKTLPFPKGMMGSQYVYAGHRAREMSEWLTPIGEAGHSNLECFLAIEAAEETDTSGHAKRVDHCRVYVLAYGDDAQQSRDLLNIVASSAPKDPENRMEFLPMSFADLYGESITGPPMRILNDSIWTDDPIAATGIVSDFHMRAPSAGNVSIIDFRSRPRLPAGAPMRAGKSYVTIAAQWKSSADDGVNAKWLDDVATALKPLTVGCYLNETDIFARRDRLAQCFTADGRERLRAIRAKYDPKGMFPTLVPL